MCITTAMTDARRSRLDRRWKPYRKVFVFPEDFRKVLATLFPLEIGLMSGLKNVRVKNSKFLKFSDKIFMSINFKRKVIFSKPFLEIFYQKPRNQVLKIHIAAR